MNLTQKNILLILFYSVTIFFVLITYEDYGVHIEEKFHRLNGHYWLNYISKIFGFLDIQQITENKIKEISDFSLSSVAVYNKYGILFDLPTALIEILFNLNDVQTIYYLKHLLSFFIFLVGSFFFFKILQQRYNFFFSFVGLFLYVTTPRIFGDSFLYKDVLFLSFFSITFYFLIKSILKLNYKNLLFFAVFTSLSFNLKFFAILIPFFYTFIIIIKNFYLNDHINNFKKIIFYLFWFFIFSYIFWPYLWSDPLNNFLDLFSSVKNDLVNVKILYDGNYISNRFLPDLYIFNWIIISSPFFQTTFFFLGFFYCLIRFLRRFINIKEKSYHDDLWRSDNEQLDFIFLIFLSLFYFFFIYFDAPLYNGWRLIYFFNIFLIYFTINFLVNIKSIFRKKKINKILNLIIFSLMSYNVYAIIKFHPYQSLYFSTLISEKTKNNYEGDYYGLAAKHFFKWILNKDNNMTIKVAVASHTPIQRGLEAIPKKFRKKFMIVGQEYDQANYIFKNNISEVNSKYIRKYQIPKNFIKIYELKIDKVVVYEIFKKKVI